MSAPAIAVLGASGLVGEALARDLMAEGFSVTAIARRFTPAQRHAFAGRFVERDFLGLDAPGLARLVGEASIVVNCVGVLQDTVPGEASDVHEGFVRRLLAALEEKTRPLLVQLSIPGEAEGDATAFARTKRAGEEAIRRSGRAHAILRPGFVIAPAAYGGSALLRALAATPFALPPAIAARPLASVHVGDIARTVATLARVHAAGEDFAATFDLVEEEPASLGEAAEAFRAAFGGPPARLAVPVAAMRMGAWAGDLVSRLGWRPPLRTTALAELQRGVRGDPAGWIAATGIRPLSLRETLASLRPGVQERWFARLFLLKPLILGGLALFWIVSGLVPLLFSYEAARGILLGAGLPPLLAHGTTMATSLADIAIGALIALRRTARAGLLAGIALAGGYMAAAAVLTPALFLDPVGSLVKTAPAILLMLVALAVLEDR